MTLIKPFLGMVQPHRVITATATLGQLDNFRVWVDTTAQELAAFVKTKEGDFVGNDLIQMWSWDFKNNKPLKITPLLFSFATKEEWIKDNKVYNRFNVLACYDVGKDSEYHCRQYQGSSGDFYLASHNNSVVISKEIGDSLVNKLLSTPSSQLVYTYDELPKLCKWVLKLYGRA